jgi:hypothetical protein
LFTNISKKIFLKVSLLWQLPPQNMKNIKLFLNFYYSNKAFN